MSALIRTFLMLMVCAATSVLAAPVPTLISVDYEYLRNGVSVCQGRKEMQSDQLYLVCEISGNSIRTFVRLAAKAVGKGQIEIRAEPDEVSPDGRITQVTRPRIMTLDGEPASISTGDRLPDGRTKMTTELKVTARGL